jgi:hypothetical protein
MQSWSQALLLLLKDQNEDSAFYPIFDSRDEESDPVAELFPRDEEPLEVPV